MKRKLNLNAPPATNLLFSKPVVVQKIEEEPVGNEKLVQTKAKVVKKVAKSEVKDLQTTIYISADDYATIKGLVALKRREGDPFYNLRNAFADIAKMLLAQHPQLEPYHDKLK